MGPAGPAAPPRAGGGRRGALRSSRPGHPRRLLFFLLPQSLHTAPPSGTSLWLPRLSTPASDRHQLQSQEDGKERRHSHTIGGLPESDDPSELPSPPALSMSLSAKGQLTNIGQCHMSPVTRGGVGRSRPHLQAEASQLGLGFHLLSDSHCIGLPHGASVYPSE